MGTKRIIFILAIMSLLISHCLFTGCKKDPVAPTVVTGEISQITEDSAVGSGEVTEDGGANVTVRGVCWSTSPEPSILDFFMNASSAEVGSFNCNIIALEPETKYYVRAFATNEAGISYGNAVSFTTLKPDIPNEPENIPKLSTYEISEITAKSAVSGGNITSDGGETVLARGVCWSENTTPTISDSKTTDGAGAGSFTSQIAGLTPNTTYFVRAYATNSNGTGYGSTMSFTTLKTKPEVTTAEITEITPNSAVSGGNITYDGGAEVTARGVCWSINENPTTYNSHTTDGTGTGSFTSNITNLTPGSTYYVRAYATNSIGTSYGEQLDFVATANPPTVNTNTVTSISVTTAISGGSISTTGGAPVTEKGVCWSTSQNPSISDSHTSDGSGTGSFTSDITGLNAGTTYYVRAYATNSEGTGYGNELSFTTNPECVSLTDNRDGKTYQAVEIGLQCWMAENLAYLPTVHNNSQFQEQGNEALPAYGVYDYPGSNPEFAITLPNYNTYGVLYNWWAAMDGQNASNTNPSGVQGVCPQGWHLPSDEEWKELEMYLGMSQSEANGTDWRGTNEGGKLKSTTGWESPNTGATNETGFTGLPGGRRETNGSFLTGGYFSLWWTTDGNGSNNARYRGLHSTKSEIQRYIADNRYGFSVRCVRN